MRAKFFVPSPGAASTLIEPGPSDKQRILLISSVSLANIGQMAIDLLIYNSMDCKYCGAFNPKYTFPFAGPSAYRLSGADVAGSTTKLPFDCPKISMPLELYCLNGGSVFVLQQRSPFLPNMSASFFDKLQQEFIDLYNFDLVGCLSSLDARFRSDSALMDTSFRFAHCRPQNFKDMLLITNKTTTADINLSPTVWKGLSEQEISQAFFHPESEQIESVGETALLLLERFFKLDQNGVSSAAVERITDHQPEILLLFRYVYEGDNIKDAIEFAGNLQDLLENIDGVKGRTQKKPAIALLPSWIDMYGRLDGAVAAEIF